METINLSWADMLLLYASLSIPVIILRMTGITMIRDLLFSLLRMTVQLLLVGFYLKMLFDLNKWWANALWMLAMLIVADFSLLSRSGLRLRRFLPVTMAALSLSTLLISLFFVGGIIHPDPWYDARYMIPVFGMILGNSMRGNMLALERFYRGLADNPKAFLTYQMLGASPGEAARPYRQQAIHAAVSPQIATMATLGIVSLPGMMTGQMLGGSVPMTAIRYQIAIMICILSAQILTTVLNLSLSSRVAFNEYGMLREDIFRNTKNKTR